MTPAMMEGEGLEKEAIAALGKRAIKTSEGLIEGEALEAPEVAVITEYAKRNAARRELGQDYAIGAVVYYAMWSDLDQMRKDILSKLTSADPPPTSQVFAGLLLPLLHPRGAITFISSWPIFN